ncbi:MAG: PAS domain S-box protein, partial [Spirochaetes bacterium]|nr:PAS domain S-box protein [Spirochaetota bacterium]
MAEDQNNIKNILLVEDDPITASLQSINLKKFGYNVIIAETGDKAVDIALKTRDLDIILMDIDLGSNSIDGTQAAEKILKTRDIPILFLSSHTEPDIVEKTKKITSYGYVVKNTGSMVLNASIKMAFKLHEAQIREKEKESVLKQRSQELSALYEISKNINLTISKKSMISKVLKSIMNVVKPSIAFIFFKQDDNLILKDIKFDNKQIKFDNMPEHKVGRCLCGLAAEEKSPVFSIDISTDKRCVMEECKKAGFKSFAALPLCSHDNVIGVIGLASLTTRDFETQKQFLESLTSEISISLVNIGLFEALQKELKEKKANEKILRESENKYRILFEGSSQGILVADTKNKKFLYANPAICKMFGYNEKEFLKLTVKDIHPKETVDNIISDFDASLKKEIHLVKAIPCMRKNKTIFYADIAVALAIINGINCGIGFFTDITERLKAEKSLSESEKRYKMVSDLSSDYFFKIGVGPDNKLFLEFVSDGFGKITGRQINQARSLDQWKKIFHPEDIPKVMQFIAKLLKGEKGSIECRTFIKNNILRWIEITAKPEWDENYTKIRALIGVVKNINERKVVEESLIEAKNISENIIKTANIIFIEIDINGNVTNINKIAEKITGYKVKDIAGKNYFETLVPKDRYPYVWEEFNKVIKTGKVPKIFENPVLTKTGEERVVVWKNNLNIKNNKIMGIISFGIDITERKQMEEKLKKNEARYRMIVENINDAFYIHDFKGNFLDLNENACKMLGYS